MHPTHRQKFDLTDRLALITGGSRGLGLAMARGLAEAGAEVVLNARDPAATEAAAASSAPMASPPGPCPST
ncbi:SDR family NAD(P)-dependent oxidoreductase [Roseomonas sp. CCTCC AB2023176]|uniref:SDR family NAD(P)-dependent oxidoreductase n=1 Tax=Roseomonas sp. CCTCC AB2023176 TaxID=3342640 RepID=UPI0035D85B68